MSIKTLLRNLEEVIENSVKRCAQDIQEDCPSSAKEYIDIARTAYHFKDNIEGDLREAQESAK